MNARRRHVFTLVESRAQKAPKPQRVPPVPVALSPIPWGKPDHALGRAVCQHFADAMPPTLIRWRPSRERHVVRLLLSACAWLLVGAIALTAIAVFARPAPNPPAVAGIPLR